MPKSPHIRSSSTNKISKGERLGWVSVNNAERITLKKALSDKKVVLFDDKKPHRAILVP